jgi:hypothetical protein
MASRSDKAAWQILLGCEKNVENLIDSRISRRSNHHRRNKRIKRVSTAYRICIVVQQRKETTAVVLVLLDY